MNVTPLYCRVLVYDKRCINGINTKYKYFDTMEDLEKWVLSVKNRIDDTCWIKSPYDHAWKEHTIK